MINVATPTPPPTPPPPTPPPPTPPPPMPSQTFQLPSGVTGLYKDETRTFQSCSDSVNLANDITFSGSEQRTACVWYKPSVVNQNYNLIEFGSGGCHNRWAMGSWVAWGSRYGGVVVHTWCDYPSTTPFTASTTAWNHMCVTWDGNQMMPYVAGTQIGNGAFGTGSTWTTGHAGGQF